MTKGIIDLYLQGMTLDEAKRLIDQELSNVPPSVYRIRLFHGIDYGTHIRDMVFDEYQPELIPKIIRVETGWNQGITELVLKDYEKIN